MEQSHLSKAELKEMEMRKEAAAQNGGEAPGGEQAGSREQESELGAEEKRTRLIDPVITGSPD